MRTIRPALEQDFALVKLDRRRLVLVNPLQDQPCRRF